MISVLCVDDEQELLDLYKLFLEQSGEIQVDTADSVKTAVKKLKKTRYDVIVSDYSMPEYDGVAFLKCILPKYGDIPFIIFTGKGCEDTVIEALNNGARFYVQKGKDPKEQFADLIHKIKQAVGLKEVEDALRNSELRYRKLFETANDGILILDAESGEITDANPFLLTLLGYTRGEMLGKKLWEIGFIRDKALAEQAYGDLKKTGYIRYEDLPLATKDGRAIDAEFVSNVYVVDTKKVIQCNIRDITERKRAEMELLIIKKAVESASDAIGMSDPQGHHFYQNKSFTNLFEYTAEELEAAGGGPAAFSSSDKAREVFDAILKGRSWSGETDMISKSGRRFPVFLRADSIKDDAGKIISVLGTFTDITEHKRAEKLLKDSEARFKDLFNNMGAGVAIYEAVGDGDDFIFRDFNRAAEKIDNLSRKDILGRSVLEVFPGAKEFGLFDVFRRVWRTGLPEQPPISQYQDNRILGWRDNYVYKLPSGEIVAIYEDVTDKKQIESALRESEERYRILADAAHDAIYTLNPEGVVTFVNSGGAALIGMSPEKIVGLSLENLYHPDIAQELRENLDKVIATKRPVRFDSKFWHENQDQVSWLDAQLVPQFGPDGSVVQVIGISRSITDRKQAETLLKRFNVELEWQVRLRTAELEHANILLEEEIIQRTQAEENVRKSLNEREFLLREVHHRVKNNLQVILSLISLQSRNIKDQKLLETMGEFHDRIMAMAHVHERMCRAEDISRIDLSEIVTFLGTSLFKSYNVDPQKIRFHVEMKDLQITIDTAIPISLIINELVSNSIKHAFPKGATGEIIIAGRREADTLVLSIRDMGIGIPKDLDWMRSKQSLGHRLVVSLVEQLNGTIELDRTTGTAFNIVVKEKQ